jgi:hypothetical protein
MVYLVARLIIIAFSIFWIVGAAFQRANRFHCCRLISGWRDPTGNSHFMNSVSEKPKVIVICGPTGIGKTAVGIELARKFGGEIISADSMQIYRHMDIGTAKPTPAELAQITHHMIDIVDPDEDYDAVQFSKQARDRIAEIINGNRIPLLSGAPGFISKRCFTAFFNPNQSIPKSETA